LILICKNNEIKFKSSDKKNELIDYILLHEGEEFGEREQQIEIKQWTEKALKAVLLDTGCTVGFLGRAFLRLYESELDDQYAKILSLKKESR
jgi:CRISPR/Cas system endoribonuclease Cas6 (RAMP superfamily)